MQGSARQSHMLATCFCSLPSCCLDTLFSSDQIFPFYYPPIVHSCALSIEPKHVKSLQRRAGKRLVREFLGYFVLYRSSYFAYFSHPLLCTFHLIYLHISFIGSRSALGKYRAALRDLLEAEQVDPGNKSTKGELLKVRELLKNAVSRAPMVAISTQFENEGEFVEVDIGPELP